MTLRGGARGGHHGLKALCHLMTRVVVGNHPLHHYHLNHFYPHHQLHHHHLNHFYPITSSTTTTSITFTAITSSVTTNSITFSTATNLLHDHRNSQPPPPPPTHLHHNLHQQQHYYNHCLHQLYHLLRSDRVSISYQINSLSGIRYRIMYQIKSLYVIGSGISLIHPPLSLIKYHAETPTRPKGTWSSLSDSNPDSGTRPGV